MGGERQVGKGGGDAQGDGQIRAALVEAQAANHIGIHIFIVELEAGLFLKNC